MRQLATDPDSKLIARIASSNTLIALDYDGTLAPIVANRRKALMRPRTRMLLEQLCELYPCVVISGRTSEDIARRLAGIGLHRVIGSHGIEVKGPRRPPISAAAARALRAQLALYRGIQVEDKRTSIAIHYRNARDRILARRLIDRALSTIDPSVRRVYGKLVIELISAGAPNKGDALEIAYRSVRADLAVYVGDDTTDEDAFATNLDGNVVGVRIGEAGSSRAAYYLPDQRDIDRLLAALCQARTARMIREDEVRLGPALDFLRVLWRTDHALGRASKRMRVELGITAEQRFMLRCVSVCRAITPSRLAALLHLDPGTISATLGRLESQRLIVRKRSAGDRRRVVIELTSAGRALARPMANTVERAVEQLLATTSARDTDAVRRVLRALDTALDA
ncbi:MAG: trehalose-phosphatase [Kofleriaceae bacterium]